MNRAAGPQDITEKLRRLIEYEGSHYENIDLNRLAAFVISLLDGENVPATFETIVVALFRLFPKKFGLEGFPEYPDAARVNRALLQLRPKYRGWALGDTQSGWVLTPLGRAEAQGVLEGLRAGSASRGAHSPEAGKRRTRSIDADLEPLAQSRLFKLYEEKRYSDIDRLDLWTCFQLSPSVGGDALERNWRTLLGVSQTTGRTDMEEFLRWVRTEFRDSFRDRRRRPQV